MITLQKLSRSLVKGCGSCYIMLTVYFLPLAYSMFTASDLPM